MKHLSDTDHSMEHSCEECLSKEEAQAKLWAILEDDYYWSEMFPHSGLMPDWRIWYWDLHEAVKEYLLLQ